MYNDKNLLNCDRLCDDIPGYCYTEERISQILKILPLDSTIILICGPIAIASSIFVVYTFFKYKESREQPGDIMLAISISELILNYHWMSMVLYDLIEGQGPDSGDYFCQTESFFSISAGTSEFVYNCFFCIFIMFQIKNALKQTKIPQKIIHGCALVCITGVVAYCFISGSTGLSLLGMCSFKQQKSFGYFGVIIVILYLILSTTTIVYFKQRVPKNEVFQSFRKQFLGYYTKYVIMQTIIWIALAISNLIVELNCTTWQKPGLNFFVTIGNTAKLATSICLSFIRYQDPAIKRRVKPVLSKYLSCFFGRRNQIYDGLLEGDSISEGRQSLPGNFFDNLASHLRISEIYTMISGVIAVNHLSLNNQTKNLKEISQRDYIDKYEVTLRQKDVDEFNILKLQGGKLLIQENTKVTMYAPRFFKSLVEIDKKMVNLQQSFNINKNIKDIETQFGAGDGGRGGSFFYLTYDTKMMMKTMSKDELDILLEKLYFYGTHFAQNPNSMISRIYGIYTFHHKDKVEHVMIQRNVQNCPSRFKIRTYDMKGSTVDRQVIKGSESPEEQERMKNKKTLKDMDFQNIEKDGKIHIEEETAKLVCQELIKDSEFFQNIEVMDYSLLVFKMNWSQLSAEYQFPNDVMMEELFNNPLYSIPSTIEPGVHYHIAIIDYLQAWNAQKKGELQLKKVRSQNVNVDVSAQPPDVYGKRFIKNIAKKLFLKEKYD